MNVERKVEIVALLGAAALMVPAAAFGLMQGGVYPITGGLLLGGCSVLFGWLAVSAIREYRAIERPTGHGFQVLVNDTGAAEPQPPATGGISPGQSHGG